MEINAHRGLALVADALGESMLSLHIGPQFTCEEVNQIVVGLAVGGHMDAAESLLWGHVEGDEDEDLHVKLKEKHVRRYIRGLLGVVDL